MILYFGLIIMLTLIWEFLIRFVQPENKRVRDFRGHEINAEEFYWNESTSDSHNFLLIDALSLE